MSKSYFTIAFYNLENFFDTFDDKYTHDDDFLPNSAKRWTEKRYRKKTRKLGHVISRIGRKTTNTHPAIVGLAEVENKLVIDDLLNSKHLKDKPYDYVHYDSPDERGIDVAMIYDTTVFKVVSSEVFPLDLIDENGNRDYTRDILMVEGKLNDETIYILVNHWPSRRGGVEESEPARMIASDKALEITKGIKENNPTAKIMVMGDFNDGPLNKSIKQLVNGEDIYNPMEKLKSLSRGSLSHKRQWNLFDQILFTTNFFEYKKGTHSFSKADIFDREFLRQFRGKYRGNPFRTFVGRRYKGGFSDHFPVYIHLKRS